MSSTALSAVDQNEVNSLLNALNGGGSSDDVIKVPFLKVQYDNDDAQGRDVKRGSLTLSDMEEPIYADTLKIRVLAQHFQYRQSDPQTYKIVNKSILMDDMRKREPRDMKGTIRCGRPDGKTLKTLSEEEQGNWRATVKAFRIVRGIVSGQGKTADGDVVNLENQPFQMFLKGMNFMPFEDQVIKALPGSKQLHDVWADLTTSKSGKAFLINFAIDHKLEAVMDTDTVETLKVFFEMAKTENERIEEAHKNASWERQSMDAAQNAMDGTDLEADFV